jgi:hypothetical protein
MIKSSRIKIVALTLGLFVVSNQAFSLTISEVEVIKQRIISDSVKSYKDNCPCPYSKMKNGKSCGKFSAYSKKGAKKPFCYVADVSNAIVENSKK